MNREEEGRGRAGDGNKCGNKVSYSCCKISMFDYDVLVWSNFRPKLQR